MDFETSSVSGFVISFCVSLFLPTFDFCLFCLEEELFALPGPHLSNRTPLSFIFDLCSSDSKLKFGIVGAKIILEFLVGSFLQNPKKVLF